MRKQYNSYLRAILGPDLVFINLKMSNDEKHKRLVKRHAKDENLVMIMEVGIFIYENKFKSNNINVKFL